VDNPWLKSVTLTNANQNYNLLALMQVVDPNSPITCQALQIQVDPLAGAAILRILNSGGSDTNWGVFLYASQAFNVASPNCNAVPTGSYWLRTDTAGLLVGVCALRL
jgi:hypothetical protein